MSFAKLLSVNLPKVPGVPDISPLWSSYFWPGGTSLSNQMFRLFGVPTGSSGQGFARGMTLPETNMRIPGVMPMGLAAEISEVGIEVFSLQNPSELEQLAGVSDLAQLTKGIWQWDFVQCMFAGGGLNWDYTKDPKAKAWVNDLSSMPGGMKGIFSYPQPVLIPANSSFNLSIQFPENVHLSRDAMDRMTLFCRFKPCLAFSEPLSLDAEG